MQAKSRFGLTFMVRAMCDFDERVAVAPSARTQVNSSESYVRSRASLEENYTVVWKDGATNTNSVYRVFHVKIQVIIFLKSQKLDELEKGVLAPYNLMVIAVGGSRIFRYLSERRTKQLQRQAKTLLINHDQQTHSVHTSWKPEIKDRGLWMAGLAWRDSKTLWKKEDNDP